MSKAGVAIFDSRWPPPPINTLDPLIPQGPSNTELTFSRATTYSAVNSILTFLWSFHKQVKHSSQLKQALDQAINSSPLISCKVENVHKVSHWKDNICFQGGKEFNFILKWLINLIGFHLGNFLWKIIDYLKTSKRLMHEIQSRAHHSHGVF